MAAAKAKSFQALLEPDHTRLKWVIARVHFDIKKAWPERNRLRVKGEINGFAFRSSLFPLPGGGGYFVLVNKQMQEATGTAVGSLAKFRLEPDLEERTVATPVEVKKILAEDRGFGRWYGGLSYSIRKEIASWVNAPKSGDSRKHRAEQVAERLLLTMEGERELPPVLQAAFVRTPLARRGWELMTDTQRRRELMAIYYYKTPEARAKRVAKLVDGAVRVAKRQGGSGNLEEEWRSRR